MEDLITLVQGKAMRAQGGGIVIMPEEEQSITGTLKGSIKSITAGEKHLTWLRGRKSLVEAAGMGEADSKLSLAGRRLKKAIKEHGGYKNLPRKIRTMCTLIEENIFWNMNTRQARHIFDEALGAGTFDSILIDAQFKRMIKGFRQRVGPWMNCVSFMKNVVDFKTQRAIQVGSFADLPIVSAQSPYQNVQFSDDRAEYVVKKYGGMYCTSMEAVVNDDLGVLGETAQRFGAGFQQTLDKFVFTTLVNDNPTIFDSNSLFDSANHNNDLGTAPLNHDNFEDAVKLLTNQTDLDGQPLDLEAYAIVVHPDEQWQARRILNSDRRPGTANNDSNEFKGSLPGGIKVTTRVTSGRWYIVANPAVTDGIEMGFLGGRREPELFQENELSGRAYEFEEMRMKGRLIFGGANTTWQWIVRANV